MGYTSEILGLVLGVVVLAATSSTLVFLNDVKKKGECKDVDPKKRDFIYWVNLAGAVASAALVVAMIVIWANDAKKAKAMGSIPGADRLARLLRGQ